jgi:MFS family permease
MSARPQRSYRELFALPSVGRLLVGMQIARIGQSMVGIAIVLYALATYRSSTLAGLATFFSFLPGIVVSPLAGALLDRHGRTRLVILDYVVALASLLVMGALAALNTLPPWLLMVIASISSLTAPLSGTGLRSLLPIIVPKYLWERANAIDSMGFLVANIIGPPLAASLVAFFGGPIAFIAIGLSFGIAAIVIAGTPDPKANPKSSGSLMTDAWEGLLYTWHNRTLRALGFSISMLNLSGGTFTIVIPLIVLQRLHMPETTVGWLIAIQGATGMISAVLFGGFDSHGRERMMLALPMLGMGLTIAILLLTSSLIAIAVVMAVTGVLNGPLDIALFTLRQRRTDEDWTGRAFAVSMSFNALGLPLGSLLAGILAARSPEASILFGVVASMIAAVIAIMQIPRT